jgi:hypothetical protein
MRKVGDLMKELGFREDGSDEVKKAFIKNLLRAAYGVEIQSSEKCQAPQTPKPARAGEQLSFLFDAEGEDGGSNVGKGPRRKSG